MTEENKKKNKIIGIGLGILIVLLVVISSTYAYWQITRSQTDSNNLIAACLDFDVNFNVGIDEDGMWPIDSYEAMRKIEGYTFTVTNNCDEPVSYVVGLESLTESSITNYLNNESIGIGFDNEILGTYEELTDLEGPTDNARYSKELRTATVVKGSPNTHNLKLWIHESALKEEQGKGFARRVFITGGQNVDNDNPGAKLLATGDISRKEECGEIDYTWTCTPLENHNNDIKYFLYSDGTLNITGTGATKSYEFEEDKISGLYDQIIFDYIEQNNVILTELETSSLYVNREVGLLQLYHILTEDVEILNMIYGTSYSNYEDLENNLPNILGQDNSNIILSLKEKLIAFPKVLNINISNEITLLGGGLFRGFRINNINIPSNVKIAEDKVLAATIINDITIEEGLEDIGESMFNSSRIENKLKLPSTLNITKGDAFNYAIIKSLELPANKDYTTIFSSGTFTGAVLEELIIPTNITSVENDAFLLVNTSNITLKLYGSERTIEGLDFAQFKEVIWNYTGE